VRLCVGSGGMSLEMEDILFLPPGDGDLNDLSVIDPRLGAR